MLLVRRPSLNLLLSDYIRPLVGLFFTFNLAFLQAQPAVDIDPCHSVSNLIELGYLDQAQVCLDLHLHPTNSPGMSAAEKLQHALWQGDIFFYQQKIEQAENSYYRAASFAEQINNFELLAESYFNVGVTLSMRGMYGEALKYFDKADVVLDVYDSKQNRVWVKILLSKGLIYANVGAIALANETLMKAQSLAWDIGEDAMYQNATMRQAVVYFDQLKFQSALEILNRIDSSKFQDFSELEWYYGLLINSQLALSETDKAREYIAEAVNVLPKATHVVFEVLQIESYLKDRNVHMASSALSSYLAEKKEHTWLDESMLAQEYHLEGRNHDAVDAYLRLLDKLKEEINLRGNVFSTLPQGVLKNALEVIVQEQGTLSAARIFDFFWFANLASQPAQLERHTNQAQVSDNEKDMSLPKSQPAIEEDVLQKVKILHRAQQPQIEAIQKGLDEHSAVIAFATGVSSYYALFISHDTVKPLNLRIEPEELRSKSIQLNYLLDGDEPNWIESAYDLRNILLEPFLSYGLSEVDRLYVIQDVYSRFIPFDLLPDASGEPLVQRTEVVISSWRNLLLNEQTPIEQDEKMRESHHSLHMISRSQTGLELASHWRTAYRDLSVSPYSLRFTAKEAQWLGQLSSDVSHLSENKATETAVKNIMQGFRGVLHFSTHGFDNPLAPAFSSLVLGEDVFNDGLLQAREVANMFIPADLVVLASCSSAKGGMSGEYGLASGFAESFIEAGARSVIGTIRDVRDDLAYQFNKWFYQGLLEGMNVSQALRMAKLTAREQGWAAKDWSAYVLLGRPDTKINLSHTSAKRHYWVAAFSVILCVLIFIVYRARRQPKN